MFEALTEGLRKATRLTGASRLTAATAAIQHLLQSHAKPDGEATLRQQTAGLRARMPGGAAVPGSRPPPTVEVPAGARFLPCNFANHAGSRPYKLYVPASYSASAPAPLIVMLHGCTQTPDDFAAGTRMNQLAERSGFLVAYPAQIRSANMQKCWNWFDTADQGRDAGEPSLIAGITRQVMADYAVDAARVFVAGLSAGGAAAAIMGHAYPDLYAAIGIHSGLACGAAHDMPSAFAAMRQGAAGHATAMSVPTIIFHGDSDTTVSPRNGDAIVSQLAGMAGGETRTQAGQVAGGHRYTRTVHRDAFGSIVAEHWVVRGAAHAWSGGSPSGSYTDRLGPDASAEMVRFFLEIATQKGQQA